MTIPLLTSRSYTKPVLLAGLSLAITSGLLTPVRADVAVSVDKGQATSQHKTTAPAAANASGGGNKKGGSTTDTITGSVFYTITARNLAATPAKGVTIEYHIYNKTTTTSSSGPASVSLEDITESTTVDLAPSAIKTIESKDIPKNSTHTNTPGTTDKKGVTSSGSSSSSNTAVMGWVVYVKAGERIIHTTTSSDTILAEVAKIKKLNGG